MGWPPWTEAADGCSQAGPTVPSRAKADPRPTSRRREASCRPPSAFALVPGEHRGESCPVCRREIGDHSGERGKRIGARVSGSHFALSLVVAVEGAGVCVFRFAGTSSGTSGGKRRRNVLLLCGLRCGVHTLTRWKSLVRVQCRPLRRFNVTLAETRT